MAGGPTFNPEMTPNSAEGSILTNAGTSAVNFGGAAAAAPLLQQALTLLQGGRLPYRKAFQPEREPQDRLNAFQLQHRTWTKLFVRHPTILWPIRTFSNAGLPGFSTTAGGAPFEIYYRPCNNYANTPNQTADADTDLLNASQVSTGAGIVYLPTPGEWHLFCGTALTDRTDLLQIDATDPLVAARYLSEAGCHRISVNAAFTASAAASTALAANRNRIGWQLWNTSATAAADLNIDFGRTAVAGAGVISSIYHIGATSAPNSMSQFGPFCFKGDISVIRLGAVDAPFQVMEWV